MCGRENHHEFIIVNFSVAVGVHTCEDSIDLQEGQRQMEEGEEEEGERGGEMDR